MGDGQRARAVPGQVLDDERVRAADPAQGEPEIVAGGHQADLVEVGIAPAVVVDQEQRDSVSGSGRADQPAPDVPVAPRPGVEPELADDLEPGDARGSWR